MKFDDAGTLICPHLRGRGEGGVPPAGGGTATGTPEEYVQLISSAGFTDVRVVSQTRYRAELAFEDSVVEVLTNELGVALEAIEEAARSMLSVSVVGHKPA